VTTDADELYPVLKVSTNTFLETVNKDDIILTQIHVTCTWLCVPICTLFIL